MKIKDVISGWECNSQLRGDTEIEIDEEKIEEVIDDFYTQAPKYRTKKYLTKAISKALPSILKVKE